MSNTGTLKKNRLPLKLLGPLTQRHPLKLSVDEWKSELTEIYPALQALGFLKPSRSSKQVLCPNCNDHYVDVIVQNDKFYAVCDQDDSAGRMLIDKSQLSQETF